MRMESLQRFADADPADLVEMSKQGYFTIMPDENLRGLESDPVRHNYDEPVAKRGAHAGRMPADPEGAPDRSPRYLEQLV
jgi:hypothetical protein